ncbi:MAG: hypothetical protein LBT64_00175 [Puniceicoccales bacterium]|nr:hypothetical protein [Puniceicoccales bacterium]
MRLVCRLLLKLALIATLALLVIMASGNLWVPRFAETALTKASAFTTKIGKSNGSLFEGRIDFGDVEIKNPSHAFDDENFMRIRRLFADVDVASLFKNTLVIEEVDIDVDHISIVTGFEGADNCSLFEKNLHRKAQPHGHDVEQKITRSGKKREKSEKKAQAAAVRSGKKKSLLLKKFSVYIDKIYIVNEEKKFKKTYDIKYRGEFTDVSDLAILRKRLVNDLVKHGISFLPDMIISSIADIAESTLGSANAVKNVSLNAIERTGNRVKQIGGNALSGLKGILKSKKLHLKNSNPER